MINKIKTLLGISDSSKNDLLNILLEQSIEECRSYIGDDDLTGLDSCIIQIVIYKYNRLGTEGLNSEGYSGVSFNYTSDYPEFIIKQLNRRRKVQVF